MLRKGNKAAFLLRSGTDWMNDHYGLVAGKVEEGESYTAAAVREGKEEAGVTIKVEDLKPVLVAHRNSPGHAPFWVDVVFEVTKWQGTPHNAEPHMHSELTWFGLKHLPTNLIPAVRFFIEQIQKGELFVEYGWDD